MTTNSHRHRIAIAAAMLLLAACGSSSSVAAKPKSPAAKPTGSPGAKVLTTKSDLRGKRYCEVLLLHPAPAGITADVYNTFPLNDCPDAQWKAEDGAAIKADTSSLLALLNGPRYWLMDGIEKQQSGPEVRKSFGGMEMIQRATVLVGNPVDAAKPYVLNHVDRATVFSFDAGRNVYELTAPDGSKFVMQSWSQQVVPTLSEADLFGLASQLQLPAGWTYGARRLTAPLRVVTTKTTATVVQDDLKNTYSMETT